MRYHVYVGMDDKKLQWLRDGIVAYDVVEMYGQMFHILVLPEKLGEYNVVEITNFDTKFPMKRLYRWFARNNIADIGPMTLKQFDATYPKYAARWFTDGTYEPEWSID